MKKYIIWSSYVDPDDWEDYMDPNLTDEQIWGAIYEENSNLLMDERINLDIQLDDEIVIIANLGLWNGNFGGYHIVHSGNIKDCLCSSYDPTWFVDQNGDFRCDETHHDGTNHFLYRTWKSGLSDAKKENFLNKCLDGKVTRRDITNMTMRIGDKIANVYGWKIRRAS